MTIAPTWNRFKSTLCTVDEIGLRLDWSRMHPQEGFLEKMSVPMHAALEAMRNLEQGTLANFSESRMVGHYWLRAPELAPRPEIRDDIRNTIDGVLRFAADIHSGAILPQRSDGFLVVLVIGIGGSALGAQFVCDALGTGDDPMIVRFLDNTDPDGIDRVLTELDETLDQTLTVVISKSGTTVETRNGLAEVASAYQRAGLDFSRHAVAVTCDGSTLHLRAEKERWFRSFPMWDWVGGRTSVFSAAGLLPIALTGGNVEEILTGARFCDAATRNPNVNSNPAALLALMWYHTVVQQGKRNLVVLPYRDRLEYFGRYLQQLVMESLGKETDRSGRTVHQGLTVYGNKGSTDQHAFVQQLRDGPDDFVALFVEVLKDRESPSALVEPDATTGDYLHGFLHGTRAALTEKGRESLAIGLRELTPRTLGGLIALFERTVGLYAELINVNAYDQPGVEAGKKAASALIELQRKLLHLLRAKPGIAHTVESIADGLGAPESAEMIFHLLEHVSESGDHGVVRTPGKNWWDARYSAGSGHKKP